MQPSERADYRNNTALNLHMGLGAAKFLQPLVATVISTLRAPKSSEGYKSIGGGSPLRRITQQQADALSSALQLRGLDACVYVGMRYWKPFTEEAIAQVFSIVSEEVSSKDMPSEGRILNF